MRQRYTCRSCRMVGRRSNAIERKKWISWAAIDLMQKTHFHTWLEGEMDWTTKGTFSNQCRSLVKRVLTSCWEFVKSISLDWRYLFQKNLSSAYTIQLDQHNKFILQSLQQVLPFPKMPSVRLSLSFPTVAATVALNPTGRRTRNFPHVNVT